MNSPVLIFVPQYPLNMVPTIFHVSGHTFPISSGNFLPPLLNMSTGSLSLSAPGYIVNFSVYDGMPIYSKPRFSKAYWEREAPHAIPVIDPLSMKDIRKEHIHHIRSREGLVNVSVEEHDPKSDSRRLSHISYCLKELKFLQDSLISNVEQGVTRNEAVVHTGEAPGVKGSCEDGNKQERSTKRRTYTLDFLYKFKNWIMYGDRVKDFNKCPVILTAKSTKKHLQTDRIIRQPVKTSPKDLKGKPSIIHVNLSLHEDVKLNEVENAWKPSVFTNQIPDCGEDSETENLLKRFRSILNKITPKNFDVLLDEVKELKIEKPQHVDGLINLIFEKAVAEPNFNECYTKLCQQITKMHQPSSNTTTKSDMDFKLKLITRVQHEFNTCIETSMKNVFDFKSEDDYGIARKRAIGSVQFFGEFFNFELFSAELMKSCAHNLLSCGSELAVELMCKLLSTVGAKMEKSVLDLMIQELKDVVVSKNPKFTSRIRFMVLDLDDLYKTWIQNSVPSSYQKN